MSDVVMVIDDSATVRTQAGRALTGAGFRVIEAFDGLDALEKLRVTPGIALIVCDVNMPRMDGLQFIESLAAEAQHPPVLMLTTEGHPRLIQRAKASGAKGWMIKPFQPELLVAAAKKLAAP